MGISSLFVNPGRCWRWGFSRPGWALINRTLGRSPKGGTSRWTQQFLCVYLGFRFAECHQMANCPAQGGGERGGALDLEP